MTSKFVNIPADDETTVLFQTECKYGELDVVYQKWTWSGVVGESIIFLAADVKCINDVDLRKDILQAPICQKDTEVTIKRDRNGFTFVNFNFVVN